MLEAAEFVRRRTCPGFWDFFEVERLAHTWKGMGVLIKEKRKKRGSIQLGKPCSSAGQRKEGRRSDRGNGSHLAHAQLWDNCLMSSRSKCVNLAWGTSYTESEQGNAQTQEQEFLSEPFRSIVGNLVGIPEIPPANKYSAREMGVTDSASALLLATFLLPEVWGAAERLPPTVIAATGTGVSLKPAEIL